MKVGKKIYLRMRRHYFASLNNLFLLIYVSNRWGKYLISFSLLQSFYGQESFCEVAKLKFGSFYLLRKHKAKNLKCPLENFAQRFGLCMILILIQHGLEIRKSSKDPVCTHCYGFTRFCPTMCIC